MLSSRLLPHRDPDLLMGEPRGCVRAEGVPLRPSLTLTLSCRCSPAISRPSGAARRHHHGGAGADGVVLRRWWVATSPGVLGFSPASTRRSSQPGAAEAALTLKATITAQLVAHGGRRRGGARVGDKVAATAARNTSWPSNSRQRAGCRLEGFDRETHEALGYITFDSEGSFVNSRTDGSGARLRTRCGCCVPFDAHRRGSARPVCRCSECAGRCGHVHVCGRRRSGFARA